MEEEKVDKEEAGKGNVDENSTSHEISSQDGANSSGSQLALSQSSVDLEESSLFTQKYKDCLLIYIDCSSIPCLEQIFTFTFSCHKS